MSSPPPPTKPPRGVKQGKETSGLLMSVIRTLSASETNEQREKERAKLEKEYKKSDAKLDELVAAHAQEIMEVMQKFSAVGAALTVWGQHCDAVSARLAACRGLLQLRRDDLKRLWMTARTHHYALQMLTDIESVVVSEREARAQVSVGRVLACAHTLQRALHVAAALTAVHALAHTRRHLQGKKQELTATIVRRLSGAVYRADRAPPALSARRRTALLLAELTKTEEVTDAYLQDITPEFEASLTEEDKTFNNTVMISLEALGVLEQLQEATELFKVQIQNELLEVIDTVSRRIIEEGDIEPEPECEEDGEIPEDEEATETGRPLGKLFTILVEEFRACAARNKRLLQLWRAALQKYRVSDSCLHTEQHYWSAVQQVMQLLVTQYLEIERVAATRGAAAAAGPLPLADYFGRRRPPRRRHDLFKLAAPPAAAPTAGAAGAGAGGPGRRAPLVCRPQPAQLPALLPALQALCADIEPLAGGGECSLRAFLSDYVRSGEAGRLGAAVGAALERAARPPAAWRERTQLPAHGGRPRTVFSCCVRAWSALRWAAGRARACAWCGGAAALGAPARGATTWAAAARAALGRAAPPTHRALRWLADDDIVRFLQTLPNWQAVVNAQDTLDTQEMSQAYEREAEILGSSLGDGAVSKKEIISDVNTLVDLAVLCESMEWMGDNVRSLPRLAGAARPAGGGRSPGAARPADAVLAEIETAAAVFDDISHKCLLLLHLELRIQCFHYLGQGEGGDGGEGGEGGAGAGAEGGEGGGAARLAQALLTFHEQAAPVLAPHRMQYVVSGVGEMMSAAVVWRVGGGGGAGAGGGGGGAGGAALGTLRHCLAALSEPASHRALHRAHLYLQLHNTHPEEIIASIREKGAQFSELEYLNAFKVIAADRGLPPALLRGYLQQLAAALGHVGVTV